MVVRPALARGEVVVCDRFVLTSLALHGSGRGADVDRIRSVNAWSTGGLQPDLVLVVDDGVDNGAADHGVALTGSSDDVDAVAARATLLDEAAMNSDRFVVCLAEQSDELPEVVLQRLDRLLGARTGLRRIGEPPRTAPHADNSADDSADDPADLPPVGAGPPTGPQLAPTEPQPR
jgi:dTMP kinase